MKPGVREILAFLKERGVPAALATSTGRPRTERRMEMTGLGPYFSAIITGDQVEHSKPDPEIYLLACQALGTDPEHTFIKVSLGNSSPNSSTILRKMSVRFWPTNSR